MPNGRPADHPVTDILMYGFDTFSPRVNDLIREIARLYGPEVLFPLETELFAVEAALGSLENQLVKLREELGHGSTQDPK